MPVCLSVGRVGLRGILEKHVKCSLQRGGDYE